MGRRVDMCRGAHKVSLPGWCLGRVRTVSGAHKQVINKWPSHHAMSERAGWHPEASTGHRLNNKLVPAAGQ